MDIHTEPTPFERAKRAIHDQLCDPAETRAAMTGRIMPDTALDALVHAVLSAIREPDEAMKQAGSEIIRHVGPDASEEAYLSDAANTFRFMIDAVLQESAGR